MWQVSQAFIERASANGRRLACKIQIGENIFYDNQIISFTFNDLVHENNVQIGTALANRFHVKLAYNVLPSLDDEVKVYLRFLGEENSAEEWCPLGVFRIARRYLRGNRLSLTCYDKLYFLDEQFKSQLTLPTTAQALLDEVCQFYGLSCGFVSKAKKISFIPEKITAREIIGSIAGINACFAKINRQGELVIKPFTDSGFTVNKSNYIDFDRNVDQLFVNAVVFETPFGEVSAGEGGVLSTIRSENAFAENEDAVFVLSKYEGIKFYAGNLRHRGLPFLEAGEFINVQNEEADGTSKFLIGEIQYAYDGGLTAKIISKNMYLPETYVTIKQLTQTKDYLLDGMNQSYVKETNKSDITINTGMTALFDASIKVTRDTFIHLNTTMTVVATSDCVIELFYIINDVRRMMTHKQTLKANEPFSFCCYHLDEYIYLGVNSIQVMATLSAGTGMIAKDSMAVAISAQWLSGKRGSNRAYASLYDMFDVYTISQAKALTLKGYSETVSNRLHRHRKELTDVFGNYVVSSEQLLLSDFGEVVTDAVSAE